MKLVVEVMSVDHCPGPRYRDRGSPQAPLPRRAVEATAATRSAALRGR